MSLLLFFLFCMCSLYYTMLSSLAICRLSCSSLWRCISLVSAGSIFCKCLKWEVLGLQSFFNTSSCRESHWCDRSHRDHCTDDFSLISVLFEVRLFDILSSLQTSLVIVIVRYEICCCLFLLSWAGLVSRLLSRLLGTILEASSLGPGGLHTVVHWSWNSLSWNFFFFGCACVIVGEMCPWERCSSV